MKTYSKEEEQFLIKYKDLKISKMFECPDCDTHTVSHKPVDTTPPIFTGDLVEFDNDPGLTFLEVTDCRDCSNNYIIRNGC